MPDESKKPERLNPREDDIMAGDRRISRPDSALPDWHIPDASYRPIPIAWFAGAFLLQMVVLFAVFVLLANVNAWATILLSALVTGMIGAWTWARGMREAGNGWKAATIAVMAVQFIFVALGAGARL